MGYVRCALRHAVPTNHRRHGQGKEFLRVSCHRSSAVHAQSETASSCCSHFVEDKSVEDSGAGKAISHEKPESVSLISKLQGKKRERTA